jgi:phosphotransferase system enzyme I (PtsP)
MAGKPLEAMAPLALGMRSISMSPASIGPVKTMILSLDIEKANSFITDLMGREHGSLRPALETYAKENGVIIDAFATSSID